MENTLSMNETIDHEATEKADRLAVAVAFRARRGVVDSIEAMAAREGLSVSAYCRRAAIRQVDRDRAELRQA